MSAADPHQALRDYLRELGAPADAYSRITNELGWHPPPIWEAPRDHIDEINQTVETPEGMRHIGWYCEHPWSNQPPYERLTEHRERKNNKRGWTPKKNTSKSLTFSDYDRDIPICPQQVPVFIQETA